MGMIEEVIKSILENEDIKKGVYSFIGDTNITYADINILLHQLQAYKDKEEKVREYLLSVIKEHETGQYDVETVGLAIKEHKENIKIVLQILNKGSDKNEWNKDSKWWS